MVDVMDKAKRSAIMSSIHSSGTRPELAVRRAFHAGGLRYRLHDRRLPGKPDIVLPRHKAVVLVQGCFWHAHRCKIAKLPSSNIEYWGPKLSRNEARDKENTAALEALGWRVFVIWECSLESGLRDTMQALGLSHW